ncbi:uncharacterized protein LOC34624475 [Cyclospora cayetanensis]|uniref:Uncharacterized protein n=2 Tax=Cyclospora cayetanensis TaxID=88456 RepID=A0A1D3D0Q2_9EIME|nr:uncharacterized protein LOC34624475 [Cyclospora cayetanensis]OEH76999.1 hypothetical protein cyc_08898 [Cyclospora cayetanensis]
MQTPGCSGLGAYYPHLPHVHSQGLYGNSSEPAQEQQDEPGVHICIRDSVRLLGEAVAVLEGVRLLGSQLLHWGGELNHVVQSFIPAALLLQMCRWIYSRTLGASRRRTLIRMRRAWQEASGVFPSVSSSRSSDDRLLGLCPTRSSKSSWLSTLRDLSALLAFTIVVAEMYLHFYVYRRLLGRLRFLTSKTRGLPAHPIEESSSGSASGESSNST